MFRNYKRNVTTAIELDTVQKVVKKKRLYHNVIIALCLIVVTYKIPLVGRWSTALFSCITYPIYSLYAFVVNPIKKWSLDVHDQAELRKIIIDRESAYQQLQAEYIKMQATQIYAQETKELRAFCQRYDFQEGIIGQVLHVISTEYEQSMLINAGSRHGVAKNMVALSHNCLLGKVVAVYPWYCKVRLITDAKCKVSALCASTNAIGIYHGCNDSQAAHLMHVSHLDTVQEGDLILSTGKGLVFPQGFALGTITHAQVNGLSYTITVKPLVSLSQLSHCLLISKESCEKYS